MVNILSAKDTLISFYSFLQLHPLAGSLAAE